LDTLLGHVRRLVSQVEASPSGKGEVTVYVRDHRATGQVSVTGDHSFNLSAGARHG
jgi:hypothetical protein